MSEKPLTPWVICEKEGKILSGHCDCMAGLGESCSHVASLLWALEAGVRKRDSLTVTDKKAYWVLPSAVKKVPYARVRHICFSKNGASTSPTAISKTIPLPPPTESELSKFYAALQATESKPVILSLVKEFSDPFVPKSCYPDLPIVMSNIYDKSLLGADLATLIEVAPHKLLLYTVLPEQQRIVEEMTRQQSESRLWFRMRTGRVTASRFKAASRTCPDSPSKSLILSICHPELGKFSTAATRWGCHHEKQARDAYESFQRTKHEAFKVEESGFFINVDHGFIGASPDGLVNCKCCGNGVCEIKVFDHDISKHIT